MGQDLLIDRKHEAGLLQKKLPLVVTSNLGLRAYCKTPIDLSALENRCHQLYFFTPILEEVPEIGTTTGPYLIRPKFKIRSEHLLAMFVKTFDNIFELPEPDLSQSLQDQS